MTYFKNVQTANNIDMELWDIYMNEIFSGTGGWDDWSWILGGISRIYIVDED